MLFGFAWHLLDLYASLGHQLVKQNEDGAAKKTVSQTLWWQLASHIKNHEDYSCPIVPFACCIIFSSHNIYSSVSLHSLSLAFQWNQCNDSEKENSLAGTHACKTMHNKYGCPFRSLRKASFYWKFQMSLFPFQIHSF